MKKNKEQEPKIRLIHEQTLGNPVTDNPSSEAASRDRDVDVKYHPNR